MYSIDHPDPRIGPPDASRIGKPGRYVAAVICLCLGVIGLVLPLIPGIPLLIVGALLMRGQRRPTFDAAANEYSAAGLSLLERLELKFWLVARRVTMRAESLRRARRARKTGY